MDFCFAAPGDAKKQKGFEAPEGILEGLDGDLLLATKRRPDLWFLHQRGLRNFDNRTSCQQRRNGTIHSGIVEQEFGARYGMRISTLQKLKKGLLSWGTLEVSRKFRAGPNG